MPHVQDLEVWAPDGRLLCGRSTGPPDGEPVLFVAGAATGRSMVFGGEMLDRLGVRLVTMDRPGMGGSTRDPERTLASTAEDYRTFVDGTVARSRTTIPVVANSQGAVFALALACSGPLSSLTLVSPADEIAFPDVHRMLPPDATRLANLALESPDEAREVLRDISAQAMTEMVLTGSSASDAAFYMSEPFATRYRSALTEGLAHGGAGYVDDTLLAMRPWGLDLARIHSPVHILFGVEDRTHSPDHGAVLSRRIPGATREVFPDVGGALLWTRADAVFDRALQGR